MLKVLRRLKESKDRGAASISCGQFEDEVRVLVKRGWAERYGFGYRITELGEVELRQAEYTRARWGRTNR